MDIKFKVLEKEYLHFTEPNFCLQFNVNVVIKVKKLLVKSSVGASIAGGNVKR